MAVGPLHLEDKSAWEQARFDERAGTDARAPGGRRLAVCLVSMTELLYSACNAAELAQLRVELSALPYLHVSATAEQHVGDTMAALAAIGQHRTSVPDLILAAVTRAGSAVVLHYDAGYERITAVTGQPHEWIVPRGSGHGRRSDH